MKRLKVLALILSWSLPASATSYLYDCTWKPRAAIEPMVLFQFTATQKDKLIILAGTLEAKSLTRVISISTHGKSLRFDLKENALGQLFNKTSTWDLCDCGQVIEFGNGIDSLLTCSVQES